MLDKLSSTLRKVTDRVANAVFLDKNLVDSLVRDLQRALIEADVNVGLVMEISKKLREEAMSERLKGVEKKEHVIKLLHDELIRILGKSRELVLGKKETWMMVGLYGAGKTTTIGKLAAYYSKRGRKVCAVGLDVHRPAAPEQLKQVCKKVGVECFISPKEKDPLKIWKSYEKEIKKYNLVLVDTAGRDAL
ncbi:MAG: signal recognition particle receptor subunit alpha, partial [Nanoarchaeota archaeon]|nr:signal recognition particle receptor subunit alpha [Nanoarchaeota archaeon]